MNETAQTAALTNAVIVAQIIHELSFAYSSPKKPDAAETGVRAPDPGDVDNNADQTQLRFQVDDVKRVSSVSLLWRSIAQTALFANCNVTVKTGVDVDRLLTCPRILPKIRDLAIFFNEGKADDPLDNSVFTRTPNHPENAGTLSQALSVIKRCSRLLCLVLCVSAGKLRVLEAQEAAESAHLSIVKLQIEIVTKHSVAVVRSLLHLAPKATHLALRLNATVEEGFETAAKLQSSTLRNMVLELTSLGLSLKATILSKLLEKESLGAVTSIETNQSECLLRDETIRAALSDSLERLMISNSTTCGPLSLLSLNSFSRLTTLKCWGPFQVFTLYDIIRDLPRSIESIETPCWPEDGDLPPFESLTIPRGAFTNKALKDITLHCIGVAERWRDCLKHVVDKFNANDIELAWDCTSLSLSIFGLGLDEEFVIDPMA